MKTVVCPRFFAVLWSVPGFLRFSLTDNVENLTLTGAGEAANDVLFETRRVG